MDACSRPLVRKAKAAYRCRNPRSEWDCVLRVSAVFLLVLAACLVLGTQLTYSAAETAYRDSIAGRLRMIALQISATIQESQSLGIALDAQDSLPALIGREAVGVPDLAAIEIVDSTGAVVFSSAAAPGAGEPVVVAVFDDLGQQIGAVRMVRDFTGETARLGALRRDLLARALPIALVVLAVAAVFLVVMTRGRQAAAAAPGRRR